MNLSDRNRLGRLIKTSTKISGRIWTSPSIIYDRLVLRRPNTILLCLDHPLHRLFDLLPFSHCFLAPVCRTKRPHAPFIPVLLIC